MSKSLAGVQSVLAKADWVGFKQCADALQGKAGAAKLGLNKPGPGAWRLAEPPN